jgi:hypothetical protein
MGSKIASLETPRFKKLSSNDSDVRDNFLIIFVSKRGFLVWVTSWCLVWCVCVCVSTQCLCARRSLPERFVVGLSLFYTIKNPRCRCSRLSSCSFVHFSNFFSFRCALLLLANLLHPETPLCIYKPRAHNSPAILFPGVHHVALCKNVVQTTFARLAGSKFVTWAI